MVSFIIQSLDLKASQEKFANLCLDKNVSKIDQMIVSVEKSENSQQSIGIAEIKKVITHIYLKPIQSTDKTVCIEEAELLTVEAQNALLKVLEEPPAHTYIYILTKSLNALLPTIISRCTIITVDEDPIQKHVDQQIMYELLRGTPVHRLVVAEKYGKQKTSALLFLEQLIHYLHEQLHIDNKPEMNKMTLARNIQRMLVVLYELRTTNVNTRLALEHAFLQLAY